jgi:lysophospholipase L1-like esterase
MHRKVRAGSKVVLVNIGVMLGLLVVVELIFGNWVHGPEFGMMNIPRNMNKVIDTKKYLLLKDAVYTRDKYGLRGDYGDDPADIEILAIGGSTTDEGFITDGETWVDILGRRLAEAGYPRVTVNAGVLGHTTVGHLYSFDAWFPEIPGLKPDYFVALIGANDMEPDGKANFLLGRAKYDLMEYPGWDRKVRQYLLNHSVLYRLYKALTGAIKAYRTKVYYHTPRKVADADWIETTVPKARFDELELEMQPFLEAYHERVGRLIGRIRDWGSKAVIVTQSRAGWRRRGNRLFGRRSDEGIGVGYYVQQTLFNAWAMKACREKKAICLDLSAELEFRDGDFFDDVHTTPQGSAKIGTYVAEKLAPYLKSETKSR